MMDFMQTSPPKCSEDLENLWAKHIDTLTLVDRSFIIEHMIVGNSPSLLAASLRKAVMSLLPDEKTHVTLAQVIQKLGELCVSDLYTMATAQAQRDVDSVVGVFSKMTKAIAQNMHWQTSGDFVPDVFRRIPFFIKVDAGTFGSKHILMGQKAFDAMWQDTCKRIEGEAAEEITLGDLEVFHTYKHLLKKDDHGKLADHVKYVLAKISGGGGVSTPARPGNASVGAIVGVPSGSSSSIVPLEQPLSMAEQKKSEKRVTTRANLMRFFNAPA